MEEATDNEKRESEAAKRVTKEKTKRAKKVLCGLSRERGLCLCLGILSTSLMGIVFPIIALVSAEAIISLNDLEIYQEIGNETEAR